MLQKTKVIYSLLFLFVSVFLPGLSMAAESAPFLGGPLVIRFSHIVSNSDPKGQMALKFKSLLEERMKGQILVEVYPNAEMLDDNAIFEGLLLDNVQMGAPSLSKFTNYTKKLQVFDLPFLFKDMQAVEKFQGSKEGQALLTSFQDRGIIGLGYLHNGMKQLSANKKLVEPEDAKELKFRIMNSDVLEAQFKAIGAEAVKKPFSQVYNLLSAGVLQGQENAWTNIYSKKLFKVQSHITESNHGVLDYMVITSVNFWDNLLPEEMVAIQESMKEALAYGNALAAQAASQARQNIINASTSEITQLSVAQRQKWVDAMKPVWEKYQGQIGKDLVMKALNSN